MAQLNISQARKVLDRFCILVLDEKNAKCIKISRRTIKERTLQGKLLRWNDKAGYFRGPSGGGISDKQNVREEYKKKFFKEVLGEISTEIQTTGSKKLMIFCPEEDISLVSELLTSALRKKLAGFKEGNYMRKGVNSILETALEVSS
ncbi:MAG: hypothetical protein PHS44_06950 [Candidatus Dojkabacteria bacterium]|jgi:hypothetical protein|nr:hypothetical protein [Candidatus Dojkabacteria bacterium]